MQYQKKYTASMIPYSWVEYTLESGQAAGSSRGLQLKAEIIL